MDAHVNQLMLDLEEIRKFEGLALREGVRSKLAIWRSQIEQEVEQLKQSAIQKSEAFEPTKTANKPKIFTKKITTYAWDQSDKFVKIYVSGLNGVQDIPKENVVLTFDDHHYSLNIHDLNNANYLFSLPKLLHEVKDTSVRIKKDEIVLMLKKTDSKKWETLSEKEKKEKEEKAKKITPEFDKNDDPSKGIMDMMKKMYDEGDDEMKRTIAKAWTQSRENPLGINE